MTFDRNDVIGIACSLVAIGLIAWLSLGSWAIAGCRDLLRTQDFAQAGDAIADPDLAALKARLETGQGSAEEQACVARIGLPFE